MKKKYMQPKLRAIYVDTQSLIAESLITTEEEVNIDAENNIESLSREENKLWDNEW